VSALFLEEDDEEDELLGIGMGEDTVQDGDASEALFTGDEAGCGEEDEDDEELVSVSEGEVEREGKMKLLRLARSASDLERGIPSSVVVGDGEDARICTKRSSSNSKLSSCSIFLHWWAG